MDYKAFEKRIANQLSNHEEPLDTEAFIARLHNDKKRRYGLWLWLVLLISTVAIGYGLYTLYTGSLNNASVNNYIEDKKNTLTIINSHPTSISSEMEILANVSADNQDAHTNPKNAKADKRRPFVNQTPLIISPKNKFIIPNKKIQNQIQNYSSEDQKENNESPELENTGVPSSLNPPVIVSNLLSSLHEFDIDYKFNLSGDKIICPDFSSNSSLIFEIIPEAGIFLPIKNIENLQTEPIGYLQKRHHAEQSLEGLNLGLYGKLSRHKFPFYLKAGISLSKLTERMQLDYAYTQQDTSKGIISITYSQTGDTITTIIGDIITEKKISGSKTRHYTFKLWDFPVVLGYEKNWNRWFAGAEIGAIFNASLSSGGHILNSDTSFINVVQPIAQFKSHLNVSYTSGIYLGYRINNRGSVYMNARIRWNPDTWNVSTTPFSQTYTFVGLYAGYGYTF